MTIPCSGPVFGRSWNGYGALPWSPKPAMAVKLWENPMWIAVIGLLANIALVAFLDKKRIYLRV